MAGYRTVSRGIYSSKLAEDRYGGKPGRRGDFEESAVAEGAEDGRPGGRIEDTAIHWILAQGFWMSHQAAQVGRSMASVVHTSVEEAVSQYFTPVL